MRWLFFFHNIVLVSDCEDENLMKALLLLLLLLVIIFSHYQRMRSCISCNNFPNNHSTLSPSWFTIPLPPSKTLLIRIYRNLLLWFTQISNFFLFLLSPCFYLSFSLHEFVCWYHSHVSQNSSTLIVKGRKNSHTAHKISLNFLPHLLIK